uniref:NADH dehydrogenase subunit 2 n=1 Tax=Hygia lativentris TaxID=763191 RepID=UPI002E75FC6A|nr:NADH dehydrogenase subunit 2 [Hygia lativentris]WPV77637.1 NADH dehydrogenase subunit 2 [Hygia lativentris]
MIMNSNKILFLIILVLSTIITMSSNNWLGMWMGLEINLMSFIPLISNSKSKKSSQAMMTYFLTQSIGSIMLLFSITLPIMFSYYEFMTDLIKILILISIMIKIGAAPFHLWLPEMMTNMNWIECMILMTWQKIAPLIIMSNIMSLNWFMYLSVIMSVTVGSIGGLNQTSLRKILAYSSINHMGWMMMFMTMNLSWYKYLIIYSLLIIMICLFLNMKNVYFMNQLNSSSPSLMEKLTCFILFLSMGGLPPFMGFLSKWMVIQSMMNSSMYIIMVMMMMFSLITLFYYVRMMTSFMLSYSTMNKFVNNNMSNKLMLFMLMFTNFMLPILMTMSFF